MRQMYTTGLALCTALILGSASAGATTISIFNADGTNEGFNDPTPVAPVAGNSGTTLGQQRLNAFSAAAAHWANLISSRVDITIYARMDSLTCSAQSGTLGAAGAMSFFANFPNAPRPDTWYPSALANTLRGADLDVAQPEVFAQFNSRLDNDPACLTGVDWWYGVGGAMPAGRISFYSVVVHELAHGLGFLTLVNPTTGERAEGLDDVFMLHLEDHSTGRKWPEMSNLERALSARDTGDLHWTGPLVQAAGAGLAAGGHPSGHIRMYAPSPVQQGSSVSHWDTALVPDELMEPFASATMADVVTTPLLRDLGWTVQQAGACNPDADTACLLRGRFQVEIDWQSATGNGAAQVLSFGGQRAENDESSFWWFFSPTNFEMGVKVLDGCSLNGKLWVFLSGLTDQGWTVRVRDTQTGTTKTYTNPAGHLSQTFADTAAFNCQ
jgi:hypothetical protein